MTSKLITTWSAYDNAVQELLDLSPGRLSIFDQDLSPLRLEVAGRLVALRTLLSAADYRKQLTIVVQQADFVRRYSPQLMNLLAIHSPTLKIIHSPPHLLNLQDSLLIADDRHALIRFQQDQARARLIIDDPLECAPHMQRFAEILGEGGDPLSPTTLGL